MSLSVEEAENDLSLRLWLMRWKLTVRSRKELRCIARMCPRACRVCALVCDLPGKNRVCAGCKRQASRIRAMAARHAEVVDAQSYSLYLEKRKLKSCRECGKEVVGCRTCKECDRRLLVETACARGEMVMYECEACGVLRGDDSQNPVVPHHLHGDGRLVNELCRKCNLALGLCGDDPARLVEAGFSMLVGQVPPAAAVCLVRAVEGAERWAHV